MPGGGTVENSNVEVPEAINKYPEVKTFGPTIPAYGLWARHVQGLKLRNISFHLKTNDLRPALVCEDAEDIAITNCEMPGTSGAKSVIRLVNVSGAVISNTQSKANANAFVFVEGTNSRNIKLSGNQSAAKKEIELAPEVNPDVVIK